MSGELFKNTLLMKRVGLALGLLILSGLMGTLLGRWTAPRIVPKQLLIAEREAQEEEAKIDAALAAGETLDSQGEAQDDKGEEPSDGDTGSPKGPVDVPVYYHVGIESPEQWPQVVDGLTMARDNGVRHYILPVRFTWEENNAPFPIAPIIEQLLKLDPAAAYILQLDLNPTAAWLQANPDEMVKYNGEAARYPSPESAPWREMVAQGFTALVKEISAAKLRPKWEGVIFNAMDEGLWRFAKQFDRSPANSKAFLAWLKTRYENVEILEAKWQVNIGKTDSITIPPEPESANSMQVFFPLPNGHRQVDFLRYTSESVANTIKGFTRSFKDLTQSKVKVFAPYGFNLELTYNAAGHFAQEGLLDGPLDGIIAPVSFANRGLGATGGMVGPLQSARVREKLWLIVDDTRTGLQRDPHTGEVTRMEGLRASDVQHLQERNFAMALLNGMGLVWSDPRGEGRFVDEEQWGVFKRMHQEYQAVWRKAGGTPLVPLTQAGVVVVVDDESRFYQQCDVILNERLLLQARDAVLMAGVNAQFCLLDDVLYGMAPKAPVYLFLNAFALSDEKRKLLQDHLAQTKASAIWMYAPGYINSNAAVENVSQLTGMTVKAFDGGGSSGSMYRIAGPWLTQDEPIGETLKWNPLFFIEDEDADTLATYQGNNKPSIAMRLQDAGWMSVFIADPHLSSDLFREIMRILEQPVYFRPGNEETDCVMYAHPDYIAVHASKPGEKTVDFGRQADIADVFDDAAGWQQKRSIGLPLKVGETRVLKLQ